MANLEEKAKLHKVAVSCFVDELEINRIKQAVELIITTSENSYKTGYLECQKEYEEKLRWISISEKLPPFDKRVLCKDSCNDCDVCFYVEDYGWKKPEFSNVAEISHWRFIL